MRRRRRSAWLLLGLWGLWSFALAGTLPAATTAELAAWLPDAGVLFLVALAGRVGAGGLRGAALVLALSRAALAIEPPVAIFAGYLAVAAVLGSLRELVDPKDPITRALVAGVFAFGLGLWWPLVHAARDGAPVLEVGLLLPWRAALGTGIAALVLGSTLAHLPGLAALQRRRF